LRTGSQLTTQFRRERFAMAADVTPERVIQALYRAGIRCVLLGTHGLNVYRDQARATEDVDVLVRKKDVPKATRALQGAFPTLTAKDTPVVTRFIDPTTEKTVLDLMKPTQKVFRMVFRHTIMVGVTHAIPTLEMALVSKFAAMTSPHRERLRKMQDTTDFAVMVVFNKKRIDRAKLHRLAEHVYAGGGKEIKELVENILAGRPLAI
jgi:hypothetical protein